MEENFCVPLDTAGERELAEAVPEGYRSSQWPWQRSVEKNG